jgi:ribonuclease D
MAEIRMIGTGRELEAYIRELRRHGVAEIALDLEGDQGSYRYRYSVSILQCFDGTRTVVLDVLSLGAHPLLLEFLAAPDIVKVMFSCRNDLFMTQNVLGSGIEPIRDIALAQKLLGLKVNLSSYLGIEKAQKDGFQRANWLKRPLPKELLTYASRDVNLLLNIEADLAAKLAERRLTERYLAACRALSTVDYRIDQMRLYKDKFPGYRRLGPEAKERARLLWTFRELVGEHFDCPVGYILATKVLPSLAAEGAELSTRIEEELNRHRREGKRLGRSFIEEYLGKARAMVPD